MAGGSVALELVQRRSAQVWWREVRHPFARPDNVAVNNTKTNIFSLKYHAKRMFSLAFPPPTTPQQLYPHKMSRPIHQQPAYVTAIKSPLEELQLNMRSPQANGLTVSGSGTGFASNGILITSILPKSWKRTRRGIWSRGTWQPAGKSWKRWKALMKGFLDWQFVLVSFVSDSTLQWLITVIHTRLFLVLDVFAAASLVLVLIKLIGWFFG